jgi:hypothetical protein
VSIVNHWSEEIELPVHTFAWNWNWTMSPACATTLLGEKTSEPLGPPTWTICVLTIPEGVVDCDSEPLPALPVDKLPRAEAVEDAIMASEAMIDDCAEARPMRADTMVDLEKYMLMIVLRFVSRIGY